MLLKENENNRIVDTKRVRTERTNNKEHDAHRAQSYLDARMDHTM